MRMSKLFIICGLPRSGTTSVQQLIGKNFSKYSLVVPDESHILIDIDLISSHVKFLSDYFNKYLLVNANGYSPYGYIEEYIEDQLILFLMWSGVLNKSIEYNDVADIGVELFKMFHDVKPFDYFKSSCSSIFLKKPTSELFIEEHLGYFKKHEIIVIYCLRNIEKVFFSCVNKLGWYDGEFFIKTAIESYNAYFRLLNMSTVKVIPFIDTAYTNSQYVYKFIDSVNKHLSSENAFFDSEGYCLSIGHYNKGQHLAMAEFTVQSDILNFIKEFPHGDEMLSLYYSVKMSIEKFYQSQTDIEGN